MCQQFINWIKRSIPLFAQTLVGWLVDRGSLHGSHEDHSTHYNCVSRITNNRIIRGGKDWETTNNNITPRMVWHREENNNEEFLNLDLICGESEFKATRNIGARKQRALCTQLGRPTWSTSSLRVADFSVTCKEVRSAINWTTRLISSCGRPFNCVRSPVSSIFHT